MIFVTGEYMAKSKVICETTTMSIDASDSNHGYHGGPALFYKEEGCLWLVAALELSSI